MGRLPARICGIDFSGGARAGRKIWVASASMEGRCLIIEDCRRGADLPGAGVERDRCLATLCRFIEQGCDAAFGLDFPFGLPRELVKETTWQEFVLRFGGHYPTAEAFRRRCRAPGRPERKRLTDIAAKTPFSPYHLWLHRQTFHGIRDLLAPLVRRGRACVAPMQSLEPGKAWVLEICPASTLKRLSQEMGRRLHIPYKGKAPGRRRARRRILADLECEAGVVIGDRALRKAILADSEGDALDSVVAALGTARALRHPEFPRPDWKPIYAIEGYVYA